jgi:hypothetical protein
LFSTAADEEGECAEGEACPPRTASAGTSLLLLLLLLLILLSFIKCYVFCHLRLKHLCLGYLIPSLSLHPRLESTLGLLESTFKV